MQSSLDNQKLLCAQPVPLQKRSVLVVEDNTDALMLQRILLEMAGYEVFTADSGTEALQVLSEINEPSLILLDMQMGDMSGIEFLQILEQKESRVIENVPIVFLTGMDFVPKSKAIGHIRKPVDTDCFLKAVRHFIELGSPTPYKQ